MIRTPAIAAAQGSANFFLIRIGRLNGVPARRPEERDQRSRRLVFRLPSMEKDSGESGSSGGLGSETLMFTGSRSESPCVRSSDAASEEFSRPQNEKRPRARHRALAQVPAVKRTLPPARRPDRAHRPRANANSPESHFAAAKPGRIVGPRPSLLTNVPSDSANVPAGRDQLRFAAVGVAR